MASSAEKERQALHEAIHLHRIALEWQQNSPQGTRQREHAERAVADTRADVRTAQEVLETMKEQEEGG